MFFVLPSLYEGFGIPLVEAMACGTPVVASDASSFPEVVGDAGLLVDPSDESLWAERLVSLLRDADLRRTLGQKAVDRARLFTWETMTEKTIDAYCKVAAGDSRVRRP